MKETRSVIGKETIGPLPITGEKDLKHRFYSATKKEQYQIQIGIAALAIVLVLSSFLISWYTEFYLVGIFTFPIVLSIIAPFFDTPSLKKSGILTYHSLLFLSEMPKNGVIKIHGGTLFDYVFVLDKKMKGKQQTIFIVQQYLQGLLNLIEKNRNNTGENIVIRGTSYIISDRTAKRIGFKVIETDFIQKIILVYNYFNIMLSYSIAKGKLSFPKLNQTRTFEINLNELVDRKEYIETLNEKLESAIANGT